jgi:hypothetical protein
MVIDTPLAVEPPKLGLNASVRDQEKLKFFWKFIAFLDGIWSLAPSNPAHGPL